MQSICHRLLMKFYNIKTSIQFTKEYTQIIKGIAILFMIFLHVGGNGGTYDVPMRTMAEYPIFGNIYPSFGLCVGIFTFLVGYGYAFANVKDWKYSIRHIWALLRAFWLILLVITVPSIIAIGRGQSICDRGFEDFVQNLFGVSESLNWYSWFVAFYIYCMIVMPIIHRWLDSYLLKGTIGFIAAFYFFEVVIHSLPFWESNYWVHSLFNCCLLMPTVLLGYYFAKRRIFQMISIPKHWSMAIVGLAMIAFAFGARAMKGSILGFKLDFFYAPISILGILIIFNTSELPFIRKMLISLGNHSVYMWFFHALFFTDVVRVVYQPLILVSDNIFIVALWTIVLTYLCSWGLKKVDDGIRKQVRK